MGIVYKILISGQMESFGYKYFSIWIQAAMIFKNRMAGFNIINGQRIIVKNTSLT